MKGHPPSVVLYDSLSRTLKPVSATWARGRTSWYSCGPTVYDHTHVGHARNYVHVDVVQRVLESFFGYRIAHVMGVTDVDDKILRRASEAGQTPEHVARTYEADFVASMAALGVRGPLQYTRVTQHMDEIQRYASRIAERGLAYEIKGEGLYFGAQRVSDWRWRRAHHISCRHFCVRRAALPRARWHGRGRQRGRGRPRSQAQRG